MATVVILLGAPGAGKGTQAVRLADALGLPHVATGDLFRENLANDTPLGRRARAFMDKGQLVPDDLVVEMLFDRVARPDCAGGYLLDGFPRTLPQAEILTERLPKDWDVQVVEIAVPDDVLVERAAGRLLCRGCKNIHHATFSPPSTSGRCDACGGELYRREDDAPEVVRERLAVYHRQTAPVVAHYRQRGVLRSVDGDRSPDEVFESLREWIGAEA